MSRSWRLAVAASHVLFALSFAAGLYLYMAGLAPHLDLPLPQLAAQAPADPSSREDRAPTTVVVPVTPPVEPPTAPPPPVPPPPREPVVSVIAPHANGAAAGPVAQAEPAMTATPLTFADVTPRHGPPHALPSAAHDNARSAVAKAHPPRPPKVRA